MHAYQTVSIETSDDGKIAILYMNRPDAMNAVNPQLAKDFVAAMPTVAIGKIKKLYDDCYSNSLEEHLRKELQFVSETADTIDFGEGCAAFLEKRKPVFQGR